MEVRLACAADTRVLAQRGVLGHRNLAGGAAVWLGCSNRRHRSLGLYDPRYATSHLGSHSTLADLGASYSPGSCVIAPGSTERICSSQSINANFIPSLVTISPSVPGYAVLQLPLRSMQTPCIFVSALVCLLVSFLIFLPVWLVYNFPHVPLPRRVLRLVRFYPTKFYELSALTSGTAFVVTLTIGIGYELYMDTFGTGFTTYIQVATFEGLTTDTSGQWVFEMGSAFRYVWAAAAFQALLTFSSVASLHNGFDEAIEYQDVKILDPYRV